ncbi:hypothetical protein JG687_00000980 [Phytophthora cactorum]|uniref:Chromo domain-containing protein n=1 Tax=Phytophthora cactorum TaxID=29920 RepID=A0A329T5H3_9STRA|nr:hypothetical protein Pcac1_g11047 [Phytophthora cactorum]KAG2840560.1 hypothetical protein PC111_g3437 [Phytophthora cactorum]KAG2849849.1 hypothetical protein PC112_g90 [Phytophthora cactorum]KAG2869279.1 hypothetical protein PC113_g342 [Phytophthora cactorum]KAG2936320.1 hypothetical protein PC114_g228 [Phytophthora cactorum]
MSLDESSVLMDRALVTMCQELPEALGLYNTAKDQFSLAAIRGIPLLEYVGPDSRKLVLIRDWMRAYEPAENEPLTSEISMDSLKETARRERKELERQLQEEKHAILTSAESEKKKKKKRRKKEKERPAKESSKAKSKEKTKAKKKSAAKNKQSKTRTGGRKRHVQLYSDDDVLSIDESSSSSDSSSESSSSSESDSDSRSKKKNKTSGNLPPKEVVLSSDEDEEPNDMFDTDDPDVYEVEKIISKKTGETYGDPDLYEVKWEGYDETTWEPASNISKDLIDEFEGQPVREDVYVVEEILDRRSKRDPDTRLKTHQYKVKWVGYDDVTWEPAENLPHNMRRKFDQKYESRKRRR